MKFYIQLAGALIVGLLIMWGIGYVSNLQTQAAIGAQRGAVAVTAQGITEDGAKDDTARGAVDTAVTTGRETFRATIEEAKRNEPEIVARADRAVPASVRGAYRQRRLARERSVGIESERGTEPAPTPAAER